MDNTFARTPEEIHVGPGQAPDLKDLDRLLTHIVEDSMRIVAVGIGPETTSMREGTTQMPEILPQLDREMRSIWSQRPLHRVRGSEVLDRPVPSRPIRAAGKRVAR